MPSKKSVLFYSVAAQKLIELAINHKLLHLGRAVQLAIKDYWGMLRKNGQDEVDHSVAITWALWERGIRRDEDLTKALLHDLVESGKESLEFVRKWFGNEIADDVERLTKRQEEIAGIDVDDEILETVFIYISQYYHEMKTNWVYRQKLTEHRQKVLQMLPDTYKKSVGAYYGRLTESAICVVIKNYDKCDIFRNMAYSLPARNQKLQIIEYEAFLAPACKQVRKTNRKYLEVLFAGRNEIESYIDNVIYQLRLRDKLTGALKKVKQSRQVIAELKTELAQYEKS